MKRSLLVVLFAGITMFGGMVIGYLSTLFVHKTAKIDCPTAPIDMAEVAKVAAQQIKVQEACAALSECLGCGKHYVEYTPFIFTCTVRSCGRDKMYSYITEDRISYALDYCQLGAENIKRKK